MGKITDASIDTDAATDRDLDTYREAAAALGKLRVPLLLPEVDPHARLYVAALDGTGNSMLNDAPKHWTAVARMYVQIRDLEYLGITNIRGGYVAGTFTQEGILRIPERLLDGRFANSFDSRVETAYLELCEQAKKWIDHDPRARINVVGVGFSRGAEQVAALQRMVEERGIRDPRGAMYQRDQDGIIRYVEYADLPLLVPRGRTLQAALLFDPVVTGVQDEERTLPRSNLSTFEISAIHERRDLFKDNDHVAPGLSEQGRHLNVSVAGSHSDIGGAYETNGLGTLSFNLGVAFLNRLSDRPFLQARPVPDDPAQFVIHRSEQHMLGLYGTASYDEDGLRDRLQDQSPRPGIQRKDAIGVDLDALVMRGTAAALQTRQAGRLEPIGFVRSDASDEDLLDRAFDAYEKGDLQAFSRVMHEFRQSPDGQAWAREQEEFSATLRAHERRQAVQPGPVMAR